MWDNPKLWYGILYRKYNVLYDPDFWCNYKLWCVNLWAAMICNMVLIYNIITINDMAINFDIVITYYIMKFLDMIITYNKNIIFEVSRTYNVGITYNTVTTCNTVTTYSAVINLDMAMFCNNTIIYVAGIAYNLATNSEMGITCDITTIFFIFLHLIYYLYIISYYYWPLCVMFFPCHCL